MKALLILFTLLAVPAYACDPSTPDNCEFRVVQ